MNLVEQTLRNAASWVQKARTSGQRDTGPYASRGVMGRFVPGMPGWWGQPALSELASGIPPARMRDIALKSPTAAAALNAVLDYASGVAITPRNVDAAQPVPFQANRTINDLLARPNAQDTGRRFRRKLFRDLITLGFAAVEIERGTDGSSVANLNVLDAARMRVDFDKHGTVLGYDQLDVYGMPIKGPDGIHTWSTDEVIWYTLDAASESQFPHSRVEQLFAAAVIESLMLGFIGARFTDTNIPFGLMDLGDISDSELEDAITLWNQQVTNAEHPEHRIVFTGSKGGAKWLPFGYALKELEAPELLSRIRLQILAIIGVTVNELGEADDVNKSNGYNLTYTFKKRTIEPLLNEFTETTTRRLLWESLHYTQVELGYAEIDSRDELLQAQIDDAHLKAGLVSINDVRNRRGDPNIPGGDEPTVSNGANIIPVSMLTAFAQAQLDALEILNQQSRVGIMQALQAMQQAAQPTTDPVTGATVPGAPAPDPSIMGPKASLPMMRMTQPPEKFTTPDATGSSTTKFKDATPAMQSPKAAQAPKAARGPVQANRNAGARKEDMNGTK